MVKYYGEVLKYKKKTKPWKMCSHFLFTCDWMCDVWFFWEGCCFFFICRFFSTSPILNNSLTLSLCCSTCSRCHFHSASWFVTGRGAWKHGAQEPLLAAGAPTCLFCSAVFAKNLLLFCSKDLLLGRVIQSFWTDIKLWCSWTNLSNVAERSWRSYEAFFLTYAYGGLSKKCHGNTFFAFARQWT